MSTTNDKYMLGFEREGRMVWTGDFLVKFSAPHLRAKAVGNASLSSPAWDEIEVAVLGVGRGYWRLSDVIKVG